MDQLTYELLEEAKNTLVRGCQQLRDALVRCDDSSLKHRIEGYVLGHIEPAVCKEHGFFTRSMCCLEEELECMEMESCPMCGTWDDCDCKCPECGSIYQDCGCEL
jgi:hypothetical protein